MFKILRFVAVLVAALTIPSVAYARSYSIDQVTIDAFVDQAGTLAIEEARTFSFDGSFHGVYWKLVKGEYEGRKIVPTIVEVAEIRNGSVVVLERSDSEQEGTYEVTDRGTYDELKIFSSHDDEDAQFVIRFTYANMVSKWEDVAELYWKFVSDGWDEPSRNVRCAVRLPVPEGEVVTPEENVRAWGHGPLDATVSFEGNEVVYEVAGVGTSEFAEARITFPTTWVPEAQQLSQARLQSILADERRWADEANAQRERARALVGGTTVVMAVVPLVSFAAYAVLMLRYKRSHKPVFDDKYFRDMPSDDHPALLGAVYRDGSPTDVDFTASLMHLVDTGKIRLDKVEYAEKGLLDREKQEQDYRLLLLDRVEGGVRGDAAAVACSRIDEATFEFLFKTVAGHHELKEEFKGPDGQEYVLCSYFKDVARSHPRSYENGYKNWETSVKSSLDARGFGKDEVKNGKGIAIGLSVACFLIAFVLMVGGIVMEVNGILLITLFVLGLVMGALGIVVAVRLKPLSREAIELKAQLVALRRWLKDFTRLDEALPTDVALWNQLLVMATVLGVADDVIRQLKVAMPRLLDDPYFYAYGWYYHDRHIGSPAQAVTTSFGEAHSVSAAKLAESSDSSGDGGGGGFSDGGGGGFGGGGGGGAF